MIIFDHMNVIDIILGVLLLLGFIRGYQKGFIIELAGIVALLAGIFGGLEYGYIAESYLENWTSWSPSSIEITSFFIVFIGIIILVSILAKILTTIIHSIALGLINRIFGAVFGVIKTGLFIFILLLIFDYINDDGRFVSETKLDDSVVVSTIRELSSTLLPSLEELLDESDLLNGKEDA
ncbi:membrane protein required for colicin V production [Psychroflexus sediminis]|uniref:Membrane protein required for colicin V production n=2 Tax=Psychroflexus sediminis TaxID=470826 RepID=A0A1G7X3K2_9FLAO|nr:membrane protein required for colicin V production [Psychroflexus sediminis]